jgi:hypothetical protein
LLFAFDLDLALKTAIDLELAIELENGIFVTVD